MARGKNEMRVIQIIGKIDGVRTPFDNQFVVEYDPSRDGACRNVSRRSVHLVTTADIREAARYDPVTAWNIWRQIDNRDPVRDDGEPNRPLTAFTVSIVAPDVAPLFVDVEDPEGRI